MFMQVANRKIYYEVKGHGPTVVFCHGFGSNHVVWTEQVSYLVRRGYRAVTFDMPEHGRSVGPTVNTLEKIADEVAELVRSLNIKSIILIGHSMGAGVVWAILKYHPELNVAKVITIDQTPKMLNDENWHYGWINGDLKLTQHNFRKILTQNDYIKETLNGIDDRVWSKLYPFKQKYPFKRKENLPLLFDYAKKDWRNTVYNIKIPELSISSAKSPYFKLGYTTKMQEHNQYIDVNIVNDTGHDIMAEKPDEFNKIMGRFLKNE